MATTRKAELNALLNPIQKTVSGVTATVRNLPSFQLPSTSAEGWSATFFSFSMGLLIIFLVLLLIHYTITPIFSFTSGDGGMIPLSNTSDGQVAWTKGPPLADVSANVVGILPNTITIQQDIYVDNELTLSNRKRVFLYRASGPVVVDTSQPEDLATQYAESNLLMYLTPNTNDLIVTAVTKDKKTNAILYESAPTILNVPTKEVFRLTVVLLPELLEVYLNGKLRATRVLNNQPLDSAAYFFSTPDAFRNSVRVMNFKYWNRAITAVEARNSGPPLADKALFNPDQMATAQCK